MTEAAIEKHVTPTVKWIENVGQNLSRSRKIRSEIKVAKQKTGKIIQPEGKHILKENEEVPCIHPGQ